MATYTISIDDIVWRSQFVNLLLRIMFFHLVTVMPLDAQFLHRHHAFSSSYHPSMSAGTGLDNVMISSGSSSQYSIGNGNSRIPSVLKVVKESDVIFGGLFPMHEHGVQGGATCGRIKREKGIQRLEAMLYAVDLLNADPDILPGLKIGLHVLDTCSDDTYALEQCMDFIKAQLQLSSFDVDDYSCADGSTPRYHRLSPVAGVIGGASSPVSIMVANILRLFKVSLSLSLVNS